MRSSPQKRDAIPSRSRSAVVIMFADIADTTWRMFLTPIIGALLGWWADSSWNTSPWLSIVGVLLGCVVTVFLIKGLLHKVENVN